MVVLVNRAKMGTATTGTGTITLGSAESGYQSFADAGVTDGQVVRYVIEDGTDWEIGSGTYTASGTTLSRTVDESSNADAALNLSGSAVVYVSATDADFREEAVGTISGNATLDLSSGNVFSHTPTADTTFVFSNPPASGTAYGMTLKITGANVVSGYDLANASYDSVSFSVAGQETVPFSFYFRSDGLKVYIIGNTGDDVNEYDLSSAWDISTASYVQNFSVSSQASTPTGMVFKPDGLKMYVVGASTTSVYEYSLSSAWNISTASYVQSLNVSGQGTTPRAIFFKPDGLKMYVVSLGDKEVNEYSLSSAWDISTASYVQNFSVSAQDTLPTGLFFTANGLSMFTCGLSGDSVYEYSLSSAWNISTASYVQSFSVSAQETSPASVFFKEDGAKMYIIGPDSDAIHQYTTGTSALATLSYPASVDWPGGTAPDAPAAGETDVLVFYTQDGGTTYYGFQAGDAMA